MSMTGKNRPEDVTDDERQLAKPCNFGLLYRMGKKGFYNYLRVNFVPDITFEEACELRERFFAGYPDWRAGRMNTRGTRVSKVTLRRWPAAGGDGNGWRKIRRTSTMISRSTRM
jgi:DNA polymerase I-like protein with 3'-5' exonuclease and polymerase domains